MPAQYGGTDTSNLANVEATTRGRRLEMQMDAAERRNAEGREDVKTIAGGLAHMEDKQARERGMELEAARSGLEFNPASKRYEMSVEAQEQQRYGRAKDVAGYTLERDKATADVLQRQQEINQRGEAQRAEATRYSEAQGVKARELELDAMREERLAQRALTEQGEAREKANLDYAKHVDGTLEKLTEQQIKLELGNQESASMAETLFAGLATKDPAMRAAIDNMKGGRATPQDIGRLRMAMQEQRNQVALSAAAKTGYISPLADPSSPTMQRFYSYREGHKAIFDRAVAAELAALQSMPEGERGRARSQMFYLSRSQDDRMRMLNRASAMDFMEIEAARVAYGARSQGGAGGAQPAGPPGSTKLGQPGAQSQPQSQQQSGYQGFGFSPGQQRR